MRTWFTAKKPILALAPMADMTDSAFCQTAREASGPDFVIFREMVSAEAVSRNNDQTLTMAAFSPVERPIVQQLFGADPDTIAEATGIIDGHYAPDGFDVNMGCPARKIIGNFNGAALMRQPDVAAAIVKRMKQATDKPVSVKTRLGWSRPDEILEFAKAVEAAGADLLTVHGRTKEQGYAGHADWAMIGRVKERLSIPVILNGDITDGPTAKTALEQTGCGGLMVGRAALGNPWIFAEIRHFLENRPYEPPTLDEVCVTLLKHAERHVTAYPGPDPLISLRTHLTHYFKGLPGAKAWRERAVRIRTLDDLRRAIENVRPSLLNGRQ